VDLRTRPGVPVPRPLAVFGAWGWRIVAGLAAVTAVLYILLQIYVIVVPLLLSLLFAAALHPPVGFLRRHGWPSWLATVLVFLVALAAVVGLSWWFGIRLMGQFDELVGQLQQAYEQLRQWLTDGPLGLTEQRIDQLRDQVTSVGADGALLSRLAGRARQLGEFLGALALLVVFTFFLLKDGPQIGAWIVDRAPDRYREDLHAVGQRSGTVLRQYLVGTAGVGLVDAVLLGLALVVLGVPLVLPLAVITFFGAFLPLVGAFVSGGLAALVGLVAGGLQTALLVVLAAVIVQQLEGNIMQPLIVGEAVSLHPLVTLSAVSAGLLIAGVLGGVLAVPLVAVIARIGEFYRTRDDLSPPPAAHAPLVRVQLVESGDGSPPRAAPSTRT
jgi:predicted PurR-regulated permease PerM